MTLTEIQHSNVTKNCNYGDNRKFLFDHTARLIRPKLYITVVAAGIFENNLFTFIFSHVRQSVMLEELK